MSVLSDAEWRELKAVLDQVRSGEGRRFQDERRTLEAVIWRLRNGARWRAVPAELGPWWRAAQLHIRWARKGLWTRVFQILRDRGRPDLAEVFLDGTSVRAHAKAAGAKGGRGGTRSGARAAGLARKPVRSAMRSGAPWPSRSCPARGTS
jgi:transposase